jgi:hypothetical protein
MAAGGQASIMAAHALTADEHGAIVQAFRDARSQDFKLLTAAIDRVAVSPKRLSVTARRTAARALRSAQQRLTELEAIDFGESPARVPAAAAVSALAKRLAPPGRTEVMTKHSGRLTARTFNGRTWVTRPRPGVDRMSSAWLIRRFIDARARFAFRASPRPASRDIPFDMFGVEFGHDAHRCTFEVLASRFGIDDPAVRRLGEIVHDVDLKDARYGHPESAVVHELVEGLRRAHADDKTLLEHGMAMFGGLFESFKRQPLAARRATRGRR